MPAVKPIPVDSLRGWCGPGFIFEPGGQTHPAVKGVAEAVTVPDRWWPVVFIDGVAYDVVSGLRRHGRPFLDMSRPECCDRMTRLEVPRG